MVRKKTAWRRSQEPRRKESWQQRQLRHEQTLNEKLQMACDDIEAMGLQDSDDDDGGIPLNQDDTVIMKDSAKTRDDVERTYFQQPITSINLTEHLWQLPVMPVNDMGPKELKKSNLAHPISYQYHRHCQMITKHWGCQPSDCVPGEMKIRTPYSLGMLAQMRRLANSTKDDYDYAISLVMEQWVERVKEFEAPPEQIHESEFVETVVSIGKKACERVIYENVYGLMVCDVSKAIEGLEAELRAQNSAKQMGKAARKAAGANHDAAVRVQEAARQAAVAAVQAEKTKIVIQRRRENKKKARKFREERKQASHAAAHDHPDIDSIKVSLAPPNSPVANNNDFAPLAHISTTKAQADGPLMEGLAELSHSDKENYKHMAILMDKMGMNYSKPSHRRRLDKLAAGGLSRLAAPGPLPFERLDLSNISPLPTSGFRIDPEELARLGQQSLPD